MRQKHFCDFSDPQTRYQISGSSIPQFCSRVLRECILRDTQPAISLYLALWSTVHMIGAGYSSRVAFAWDFHVVPVIPYILTRLVGGFIAFSESWPRRVIVRSIFCIMSMECCYL